MASLLDLLAAYQTVKADIAAGEYLTAYEDSLDAQRILIEFAKSLGVKALATDKATSDAIVTCVQDCQDLCVKDKKVHAVGTGFDWKSLLMVVLQGFLAWWSQQHPPTP